MGFKALALAVALGYGLLCNSAAVSPPTVDLGYAIHQATLNSSGQNSYLNFSNIRFGQAPLGPLRFSAPLAPRGRNTTVNDGQGGVICPQANPAWLPNQIDFLAAYLLGGNITQYTNPPNASTGTGNSSLPEPDPRTSEDCLFLDVIVPEKIFNSASARKKRQEVSSAVQCKSDSLCAEVLEDPPNEVKGGAPVLVWIYGGGYVSGDKTSSGNPAGLIARSLEDGNEGIVYVAMNYRLGLFGWLSGADNVTANAGLLDQRLALEWIRKNIHLFGGDPSRVTVMGESAGAGSIMHHITSYGGKGSLPFQQAIPQSPAFQPTVPAQSKTFFEQVVGNASLVTISPITSANDLRRLPFDALYATNTFVTASSSYGEFTFGPVVDPVIDSYVPDFPLRLLGQGLYHHNVSIVVGHNQQEGLLFTPPFIQTDAEFKAAESGIFPTANASLIDYISEVLYPPVFNGTYGYKTQIGRTNVTIADFTIHCNAHLLASTLAGAYAYLFTVPPGLHAVDIPYTFFNGDTSTLNQGRPVDAEVAKSFQRYLVNFVMTGKPTSKGLQPFVEYGSNDTVANIDATDLGMQIRDPAARSQCKFWQAAPYYQ